MTEDSNKSLSKNINPTFNFMEALSSGVSEIMAMAIQVCSIMWLRTRMNCQYRYGGTMVGTIKHLQGHGGILRFYKGLAPALIQGPMSRFGDIFANTNRLLNQKENYQGQLEQLKDQLWLKFFVLPQLQLIL